MNRQSSAAKNTVLALWVWPITILASTAGYIGDLLLDGVDSAASALAEGLIADGVVNGFTIFGASGSIVFGLLTWLFLSALIRRASEIQGATNATAR